MRHSSENIQQQRPFTTIATTTSTNVNKTFEKSYNSNNDDTIPSLLNSHQYSVTNKNYNQNLNINRSVSSPITGKLGNKGLGVASVNALYNEYCSNDFYENYKTNARLYEKFNDIPMNRNNSSLYNEKRKATPIPQLDSSVNKELSKSESLMEDLDDIIESPKINSRYPKTNETNIWINTSTASDETVVADSRVLMGQKSTDR